MAGKYSSYPEYKDSGSLLLGDVPAHWQLTRVKYVSELTPKKPLVNRSLNCSFIPMEKLKTDSIVLDESKQIDAVYDGYTYFADGDILMAKVTPCFENKNIAIAEGLINKIGFGSSEIYTIRAGKKVDKRFLFYRLQEDGFMDLAIGAMTGAGGLKRVPSQTVANYSYASPVDDEQQKIANFLDHETAKIDTLIEKQQQLIKLLKEKRQAVISHAVTKGLNPNAPMRDSGVEWLGEVPEGWQVKQAKYVADITRGAILRPVDAPEYFDEEGEWAYLNISDATKCDKYLYESKLYLSPLGSTKSARVYPDNVIITASATIGKAFINKIKVCVHDGFIPFCNLQVDKSYLYHYLSNPFLYAAMGKSNTQKNIYLDEVKNMVVTVPPDEEQLAIVEHIENNAITFDSLIGKAEKAIGLMQERRTALISAAVTGKIDVRNWKAPEPSNKTIDSRLRGNDGSERRESDANREDVA